MNEAQLEKRLRYAFEVSSIVWKKPRGCYADVNSDKGKHTIRIPPEGDDDWRLRSLIHELCHVAIPGELGTFGTFEEDILERVIEPRMMDHLLNRPAKHKWWLKKLRESKEGQ